MAEIIARAMERTYRVFPSSSGLDLPLIVGRVQPGSYGFSLGLVPINASALPDARSR